MPSPSTIDVNLGAVDHNARLVRRVVGPKCRVCGVVKSDGYGLGAVRVARCLERSGVGMLAVFTADQAAELFTAAVRVPILVLMPTTALARTGELYRAMLAGRLHLAVHDRDHLGAVVELANRFGVRLPVHVAVDIGMSRGGCAPDEACSLLRLIVEHRHRLVLAGVYSHFPCADVDPELTAAQLDEFEQIVCADPQALSPDCLIHVANTFATFRGPRYHRSMVRIGLGWAGYGAELIRGECDDRMRQLRPTMTWSSRLIHVKRVPAGAGVGYGHRWSARKPTTIGIVPVGYADGYPTMLAGERGKPPRAHVAIVATSDAGVRRVYAPVVGGVSMEQIAVDLTGVLRELRDAPEAVRVGTTVELVSDDPAAPNHLTRLAEAAGTLPHVLLCGLGSALPRRYEEPAPAATVAVEPRIGLVKRPVAQPSR